jgi:WD40 repeat protein
VAIGHHNDIHLTDIDSGVHYATFTGHSGRIQSILIQGGRIITGADDNSFVVWYFFLRKK